MNLVDLTRRVAGHLEEKRKSRQIYLTIKEGNDLPQVAGDAQNLERALTALLDNAIKFSHDGGAVEIRLHHKDDQVAVEVSDQGIGIQPEILPHIFERFYHVDKSGEQLYEGLGLGLAITRQVIEQHKGRLEVVSTPGQGSTFTMWLNMWKEAQSSQESSSIV